MRYYLKLGPMFHNENCRLVNGKIVVEDQGGKLPGLADPRTSDDPGGQCGNGNQTADGIHCWTHRTGFRDCGQTARDARVCRTVKGAATRYHGYIYFDGQQPYTGNPAYWDRGAWNQFTGRGGRCATEPANLYCGVGANLGVLIRERWYALEHFIGMNTPGQANGVIRGRVDGQLADQKTNMILRVPGHDNLHIRSAWLNAYKAVSMATASTARSGSTRWCSRPTHLSVSLRPAPPSRYRRGPELARAAPDVLRAGF
jgi:hypothetical protein